jgi:hypothetical protein
MAQAYSYDLRQKVINAIKLDGLKKSEAAQVLPTQLQPNRPMVATAGGDWRLPSQNHSTASHQQQNH